MTPGRIKREKYKKGNKVLEAAALHYKNGENRAPVVAAGVVVLAQECDEIRLASRGAFVRKQNLQPFARLRR